MALTDYNARRSALAAVRRAYRKLLVRPTEGNRRAFEDARQAARDAGTTARQRNAVLIGEQNRRELKRIRRDERKAGLCA